MNTFSDPNKIIEQISMPQDASVADFGCGAGAYTMAIAKKLKTGKIFAIDVRKDMVEKIGNDAESENINNIHVVWGDVDEKNGSRLRDMSIDVVILANTLFQADSKKAMLAEASRVMKPNAQLVLIDWTESFGNIGPAIDNIVGEETAKLLVEEIGLQIEKKISAGEHHYGFIARKT